MAARSAFVLGSRATVGNMNVDVRMIADKIANFFGERMMVTVASTVNEPHGSVAVLCCDRVQDADHWRHTDAGTDQHQRTHVARHHEFTCRSPALDDGAWLDVVVQMSRH